MMQLRQRTMFRVAIIILTTTIVVYAIARNHLMTRFHDLELENLRRDVERVEGAIGADLKALGAVTRDWAVWDDAYQFVLDRNPGFVRSNLVDDLFTDKSLGLHLMLFFDTEDKLVLGKGIDPRQHLSDPLVQEFVAALGGPGVGSKHLAPRSGFLALPSGKLMFAMHPILTSTGAGPARGRLVIGRWMSDAWLTTIAERTQIRLDKRRDFTDWQSFRGKDDDAAQYRFDDDSLSGLLRLHGPDGKEVFSVQLHQPRELFQSGKRVIGYALFVFLATALFTILVIFWQLNSLLFARMRALVRGIDHVRQTGDLGHRLPEAGTDELGQLGQRINLMLSRLQQNARDALALERWSSLGQFTAGINHNFNNLLVGIIGGAGLLRLKTTDPEIGRLAELIEKSGGEAAELINQLNRAIDPEAREPSYPVAVNRVIEDVVASLRPLLDKRERETGNHIRIRLELQENNGSISGTTSGLYSLLLNLLLNAIEAMPLGGEITIQANTRDHQVVIAVIDQGTGMDAETSRHIFDPLFTTKASPRSGLGLTTVKNTLQQWQGSVAVDSTPGRGSRFMLSFPAVGAMPEAG